MPKKATVQTRLGVIVGSLCGNTCEKEIIMREKFSGSMIKVAIAVAVGSAVVVSMPMAHASA
jgi:hypothetical protein